MDSELETLRRRVAALEARLATVENPSPPAHRRVAWGAAFAAVAGLTVGAAAIGRAAGASPPLQGGGRGPTRVEAPFSVFDGGQELLRVESYPGGGRLSMYGKAGLLLEIDGGSSGASVGNAGAIRLMGHGGAKTRDLVTLGVTDDSSAGYMKLASTGQRSLAGNGTGVLSAYNAEGKNVANFGVDGRDQGNVWLNTRAGTDGVGLFVTPEGNGFAQFFRANRQTSVEIGTKGDRGDACVQGQKGTLCMSLLGVKTLTPY